MNTKFNFPAKLKQVVDGDTFVMDLDLGCNLRLEDRDIRLYKIDAYETKLIRGCNAAQKELGLAAKKFLVKCLDKNEFKNTFKGIYLESYKVDKYDRLLCDVWIAFYNEDMQADENIKLIIENIATKIIDKTTYFNLGDLILAMGWGFSTDEDGNRMTS